MRVMLRGEDAQLAYGFWRDQELYSSRWGIPIGVIFALGDS